MMKVFGVAVVGVSILGGGSSARAESTSARLEKGIYTEETVGDLDKAIEIYRKIISDAKINRRYVAQSQYRLGMCYLKKGDKPRGVAALKGVSLDFPEQAEIRAMAKKELARLGVREGGPPIVLGTNPPALANDVSPSLDKITVTFDQPMMDESWSWTGSGERYPKTAGKPYYDDKRMTCTLPVKLEPGHVYMVGVNSPSYKNFQTPTHVPAERYVILFATKSADGKPTPIPIGLWTQTKVINAGLFKSVSIRPRVIRAVPDNGARNVDPSLREIRVTFDRDMDTESFSWVGGGPTFPKTLGKAKWVDARTCVLTVQLEPNHEYWLSINSQTFKNFQSTKGIAAEPYPIAFKTGSGKGVKGRKKAPSRVKPTSKPASLTAASDELSAFQTLGVESEVDFDARPKVVEVSPADGAKDVGPVTELHIRFDQPMNPLAVGLHWGRKEGAFREAGRFRYLKDRNEFVFPMRLAPGCEHRVYVNRYVTKDTRRMFHVDGFMSAKRVYAGAFDWHFTTKPEPTPADGPQPKVVSVTPPSGSTVSLVTVVRVAFDQPMDPRAFGWKLAEHTRIGEDVCPSSCVSYNAEKREFALPVALPPDWKGSVNFVGFRSARGQKAQPIELRYKTERKVFDQAQLDAFERAEQSPDLRGVIEKAQAARRELKSVTETVLLVRQAIPSGSPCGYTWLRTDWCRFRAQGDRQFYADVSGVMNTTFTISSDGKDCYLYSEHNRRDPDDRTKITKKARFVKGPYEAFGQTDILICDPFHAVEADVDAVLKQENLVYKGTAKLDGRMCHLVQAWRARPWGRREKGAVYLCVVEGWLDAETCRPLQVVLYGGTGRTVTRFHYERINETLPIAEFRPTVPDGVVPRGLATLDNGSLRHYITIHDGSDGVSAVWWGMRGPHGTTNTGFGSH